MASIKGLDSPVNPGDQLDHYRIDSILARNNAAVVFRATDVRTNRQVAIKVPNTETEDATFTDRFRREEEIAARMDHPGIMKVLPDPDRTKSYIVMEWFEGKLLRQMLQEEKTIEPERAARIAIAICNALEYIHGQGLIHGDLRPENIMVDATDRIKLIDFSGAVKTKARRLTFTKLSQVVSTSEYLSPEELQGKRGDARGDIYSLGVILYEMLTGTTPFPGTRPYRRVMENPVPPREINPAISPQLQEVIYRALEREPRNRYPNAHGFAWDLAHLDQVGVADRDELREWKKGRMPPSRKALWFMALALIPIAILALLLYLARR